MTRTTSSLLAAGLFAIGCTAPDATAPSTSKVPVTTPLFAAGGVLHRATAGSYDIVPPGVDANYSLVAIERADGSVTGQYNDQFGHSNGGVHAELDCLRVVGNKAWVGGLVKNGPFEGQRVVSEVEDNGTSTNETPDRVSFSILNPAQFGLSEDCRLLPELPLFPLGGGEVKVE